MSDHDVAALTERFRAAYGAAPEGVWSAPGRVNLIGEHVDYNDGLCLPIALPQRTRVAATAREDDVIRMRSIQSGDAGQAGDGEVVVDLADVGPGMPGGWGAYVAGVLWALRQAGHAVRGMDVLVDGAVPLGAGLSSSAALECAVGAAASDLFGLGLLADDASRAVLAAACVSAENDVAGAATGGMDQAASLLCTPGHALALDCRDMSTVQVPFDLAAEGLTLEVIDTRAPHALVDGQYAARRATCEAAARTLGVASLRDVAPGELDAALERLEDDESRRRVRHVVTEIDRTGQAVAALRAGDFVQVGALFNASHDSLRDDYEVTVDELDVAVEAARGAGALGARMTGGGFGGSVIALVPIDLADGLVVAVEDAFAERGFTAPASLAAMASGGAARDA
ncbi:galactokinase [Janibacter sp. G1551]|uniref:galactokinase n=1 Tax=Janibacter sp. G1551 TaxID=3420440 RepID=UPI003D02796E